MCIFLELKESATLPSSLVVFMTRRIPDSYPDSANFGFDSGHITCASPGSLRPFSYFSTWKSSSDLDVNPRKSGFWRGSLFAVRVARRIHSILIPLRTTSRKDCRVCREPSSTVSCSGRSKPEEPGKVAVSCVALLVLAPCGMHTTWFRFCVFRLKLFLTELCGNTPAQNLHGERSSNGYPSHPRTFPPS